MDEEKRILFEKYEMGRLLGAGTFAKVYYGKEISTGDSVAVKIIKKGDLARRQGMTDQIKREISIMRLVRHPSIVELREVMATKTKIFFVMEHVKGGELFDKISKRGKLKEDLARKYFQQLISAIDFCHSRGVFHRDLKPENLLLDENGDLKVSDFGLSALTEQLRQDGLLHTQCGTPAYVAPEVLRKKGYDGAKADIWSCGVVLFVLLAGFLPFQDENLMNMCRKIFKAELEFPPWFSPESKLLISKLLVTDAEKRITIEAIMRITWFQKHFASPMAFTLDELISSPPTNHETLKRQEQDGAVSPRSFNAFQFISSMSAGFDLSSLFESKLKPRPMFASRFSARSIAARLEAAALEMSFRVKLMKGCRMKLQRRTEGRKGRLSVVAEVFEVAPEVSVVEFCKYSGDTLEYNKFCEEDVRPALKDIVWRWQGDHNNNTDHANDVVNQGIDVNS